MVTVAEKRLTMSNNTGVGYSADVFENMRAFDKLPKLARQALCSSDHNWSAAQCLKMYRKRDARMKSATAIAATIKEHDKRQHEKDVRAGLVCP